MTTASKQAALPRVSLALPVYNGEQYVATAIESILAQDFADFELVIADNASTDRTEEICKAFAAADHRIRYYRNERNLGACANFNRSFELSSGEFFKWCACDDYLSPNYIGACVRALETNADAVLAYGTTQSVDQDGNPIPLVGSMVKGENDPSPARRFRNIITDTGTCFEVFGLFRSSVLKKTSLHRPYYGSDAALMAEAALYGRYVLVPEATFYNREHPTRSINIADKAARAYWHRADTNAKASLEHTMFLSHLVEIAFRHRQVAPLYRTLPTVLLWAMTPLQLSRYTLEMVGLIHPSASDWLRKFGWSTVSALKTPGKFFSRPGT